jgi:hypothetical protein
MMFASMIFMEIEAEKNRDEEGRTIGRDDGHKLASQLSSQDPKFVRGSPRPDLDKKKAPSTKAPDSFKTAKFGGAFC